jgi:hypothetical protein
MGEEEIDEGTRKESKEAADVVVVAQETNTDDIKTATTSRPIGFLEDWFHKMKYTLVTVAHVNGPRLERDVLKMALEATSRRYPILRCNVDHHGNRRFCLKELIHRPFIEPKFLRSGDWRTVAEKELNVNFNVGGNEPLWRVTVLNEDNSQKLIISIHHCLSDETSMNIIVNSILCYYDQIEKQGSQFDMESIESLPMLPDAEELYFLNNTMDENYVKREARERRKKFLAYKPSLKFDHENHGTAHRRCKVLFRTGTEQNYEAIEKKVDELHISVRSVIIACSWFKIAELLMKQKEISSDKINCPIDYFIDLRRLVQPKLNDEFVGLLVGILSLDIEITMETKFWALCKQIQCKLQQAIIDEEPMYWHPIWRNVGIDNQQFVESLKKNCGRYGDIIIEDTGVYPFPTVIGNRYTVQHVHTVSGYEPYGWTYSFSVNTVNSLCYSWSFDQSLIDEETANRLFMDITDMIENCYKLSNDHSLKDTVKQHSNDL